MPLQYGTSLDMATINENSESIYFVKPPNSQQTEQMYEAHSEPFMQVDPPNDKQDVNNADAWNSFIEGAKSLWGNVSSLLGGSQDNTNTTPSQSSNPTPTSSENKPNAPGEREKITDATKDDKKETITSPAKPPNTPSSNAPEKDPIDNDLLLLQQYLQSPDTNLQQIIGNEKLTIQPSGKLDPDTKKLIELLANNLNEISGSNISINHILNTTIDDIKQAVKIAAEFKISQQNNKNTSASKLSFDDKIIIIAKKMLKDL